MLYLSSNELYHHGIKGMKWGVRRYQKKDGTLTAEGKKAYYKDSRLTAKGNKAKQEAKNVQNTASWLKRPGTAALAVTATAVVLWSRHKGYNASRTLLHQVGNMTITKMKNSPNAKVRSDLARKTVAGLFIAGMGAITAAEIYTVGKTAINAGKAVKYNKDAEYKKRVDERAKMKKVNKTL